MSGVTYWLQKQRKGELIELARDVGMTECASIPSSILTSKSLLPSLMSLCATTSNPSLAQLRKPPKNRPRSRPRRAPPRQPTHPLHEPDARALLQADRDEPREARIRGFVSAGGRRRGGEEARGESATANTWGSGGGERCSVGFLPPVHLRVDQGLPSDADDDAPRRQQF